MHTALESVHLPWRADAASDLLANTVKPGVRNVAQRLNAGVSMMYTGVQMTRVTVQISIGEYYALMSEHLRDHAEWMRRMLGQQAQKIRPLALGGLLSLATSHPDVAETLCDVVVWVKGTSKDVRKWIDDMREEIADLRDDVREVGSDVSRRGRAMQASVVVAMEALRPSANAAALNMKIRSRQAAMLVRRGFGMTKEVSTNGSTILAVAGLYMTANAMKKSLEDFDKEIGSKQSQAMMAVYGGGMGVIGASIEVSGLVWENAAKGLRATGVGISDAAMLTAMRLAKLGAFISAVTGVFDAVQAGIGASRAAKEGDVAATWAYGFSAGLSLVAAFAGGWAVATTAAGASMALMGPLGIAILLGLAAYVLYKWAEGEESTPFERWARRSVFGPGAKSGEHWTQPSHADTAIAELNAILLGVEPAVTFSRYLERDDSVPVVGGATVSGTSNQRLNSYLEYRFVMPEFVEGLSAYEWSLRVHRYSDRNTSPGHERSPYINGQVLIGGRDGAPAEFKPLAQASSHPTRSGDLDPTTVLPKTKDEPYRRSDGTPAVARQVRGDIRLLYAKREGNIEAATLTLRFWPDRNFRDVYTEITRMEVR